jgi:thiosulfate dehydrogenase [quinone] large subunit
LGVTFVFAGLQKLANPNFFSATAPGSFEQQLRGSIITSPLHHLLGAALHAPVLVAVLISLGEIAVGLGTLLGLFGRVAAAGGALLSLSFFLTVSFRDNPYYYGPDIVFLFAWTPFLLGGSGACSLDGIYARRAAQSLAALARPVPAGAPTRRQFLVTRQWELAIERWIFLQKTTAAGVAAVSGIAIGALTSAFGRLLHTAQRSGTVGSIAAGTTTSTSAGAGSAGVTTTTGSAGTTTGSPGPTAVSSTTPTTTIGPPAATTVPRGTRVGPAADVPVGGAASFTDPAQQVPALVVQLKKGEFRAFSAICPHAGCQVQFDGSNDLFVCPCHGSTFNAATGAVLQGPAATGLSPIPVALGTKGQLYVDG